MFKVKFIIIYLIKAIYSLNNIKIRIRKINRLKQKGITDILLDSTYYLILNLKTFLNQFYKSLG